MCYLVLHVLRDNDFVKYKLLIGESEEMRQPSQHSV